MQFDDFAVGKVKKIEVNNADELSGGPSQTLEVEITKGTDTGDIIQAEYGKNYDAQELSVGDTVVIAESQVLEESVYYVADMYRLPVLGLALMLFLALTVFFARWKGLGALAGLAVSIAVLAFYIVPQILNGADPFLIALSGSAFIATVSIYLAHGFSRRTGAAVLATIITLAITAILSWLAVAAARLTGGAEEATFYLQLSSENVLNLRGLLLGAIVIGALGVLDDVTTSQAAAVDELRKANKSLTKKALYTHALSIGKEHISSLVNTLVLAYAGASLPLFLLVSSSSTEPLWYILNNEFIAEEIIRTLVGSTAIVLAVPIATILAVHMLHAENG